jgi:hypothetical protein
MKRVFPRLSLPLLLCSFATAASAQQPPVDVPVIPAIPDGKDQHVYVPKGQPAPYDGFLFDGPTAARWGNWLVMWKERYRIDIQQERQVCGARVTLEQDRLKIEQARNAAVLAQYREQLELERKKNDRPWYRSFEFGAGGGAAATIGLVLVTGYALKNLD